VQAERVRVGVLGVSFDLVMAKEQRRILLDRSRRASSWVQAACRAASDLRGVPLCLLGDCERALLGTESPSGPVPAVRGLVEAAVNGAGDGNRTRMTSLEGFECGGADQRERRSGDVSTCPPVTVNPSGSLPHRAHNGHAVMSEANALDRFLTMSIPGRDSTAVMLGQARFRCGLGDGQCLRFFASP
jgi:hypothetical protein